jgi:hypothetical protein
MTSGLDRVWERIERNKGCDRRRRIAAIKAEFERMVTIHDAIVALGAELEELRALLFELEHDGQWLQ